MSLHVDAHSIPRYQTWGMMALVLLLLITIFGFFVSREYVADDQRAAQLYQDILKSQKVRLKTELASAQDYIRFMSQQADAVLMKNTKDQVDQAYSVATSIYQRLHGSRSAEDIQQLIREALRGVRFFNGRGYIFIDDMDGNCVLLPTAPQLEGHSLWNNQDDKGLYIMRSLVDAVKNPDGAGYSRYRWYPPGNKIEMKDKITYVRYFEPFDWVIGAGDYIFQTENDLKSAALKRISMQRFGRRGYTKYKAQSSDITAAWTKIPLYHYKTFAEFKENLPFATKIVGVEMGESSIAIGDFVHPDMAVYLLGNEQRGLSKKITDQCHTLIKLPGEFSLNVAVAGSIVMYDRINKDIK